MRPPSSPFGSPWLLAAIGLALFSPPSGADLGESLDEALADLDALEGPVPADRHRDLEDAAPTGLTLHTQSEAGLVARDPVAGFSLGVGFEHALFGVHLRAPVALRVWDLPPEERIDGAVPGAAKMASASSSGALGSACRYARCVEWIDTRSLEGISLGRVVDELRVGRPGDWVHARAGPMQATLGDGFIVDRVISGPGYDRRPAAVWAEGHLPWAGMSAEAFAPNLIAPYALTGGRVSARPAKAFLGPTSWWERWLSRFEVAGELAADLTAPIERTDVGAPSLAGGLWPSSSQPLVAGGFEATWPLLAKGGLFQLRPLAGGSATYGLLPPGHDAPTGGAGFALGTEAELVLPYVGLRTSAMGTASSRGHRFGVFGPLYVLEREHALVGGEAGQLSVPATGGLGTRLRAEARVLDALSFGARLDLDPHPGGRTLDVYSSLSLGGAVLSVRAIRRGLGMVGAPSRWPSSRGEVASWALSDGFAWSTSEALDELPYDTRWVVVGEGALALWGPLSATARYVHAPRIDGRTGKLRADDDVMLGLSLDLALGSDLLGL